MLAAAAQQELLDKAEIALLHHAELSTAFALSALGRHDEAITALGSIVNRYPLDPKILSCHVELARCYRAMGKPIEARAMLEQARVVLSQGQVPENRFAGRSTALSKADWETWLNDTSRALRQKK
jgi:tetratricopeptide (TPR) repeat protein